MSERLSVTAPRPEIERRYERSTEMEVKLLQGSHGSISDTEAVCPMPEDWQERAKVYVSA